MAAVPAVRLDGSPVRVPDYQPLRMCCPTEGEGVSCLDDAAYHGMNYDHAEPDPYPGDNMAKRRRLEMLDIRPAVTVYKETDE